MSNENDIILKLKENGNLRQLENLDCTGPILTHNNRTYVNLSSNDYLGLTTRLDLQKKFLTDLPTNHFVMSNPSSRLMCGNSGHYNALETSLATLFNSESALVVGSGYLLNSSILRAVSDKNSVIFADKLIHASLTDGLQLAQCPHERFRHNDTAHLEHLLQKYPNKRKIVVIESLYSMDGDHAPFDELEQLQKQIPFELIVDEAHAFGVFGENGTGLTTTNLTVTYRIATLGKACASTGAFVICNEDSKQLLINRMRSLIFSTALPPINLEWSKFIIDQMPSFYKERAHLQSLIDILKGKSQIIPIAAGSNDKALKISELLRNNGFWTTAIRHPTVPIGTERVRISLTAAHTTQQINHLCKLIGS